jgi:hypothetical protein
MPAGGAAWMQFIDANSVPLAGMVSGFLIGGLFAGWPAFSAQLYAVLFPISPTVMRRIGYVALAWGAWSTGALIARVYFGVDLMPWADAGG